MRLPDLIKATVACGLLAYLVHERPVVAQILIIAVLCLLWLSYLARTITGLRAK